MVAMRLIVVAALAGVAAWLYRSERARERLRQYVSPLQPGVRQAMTEIEQVAQQAAIAKPAERKRVASLQVQELADGSWVGNASWGGRTFQQGWTEAETVVRRLAAHLAAFPESNRAERVQVLRVPRGGEREEREQDLADLLG
jgi:hypothetical protein